MRTLEADDQIHRCSSEPHRWSDNRRTSSRSGHTRPQHSAASLPVFFPSAKDQDSEERTGPILV